MGGGGEGGEWRVHKHSRCIHSQTYTISDTSCTDAQIENPKIGLYGHFAVHQGYNLKLSKD